MNQRDGILEVIIPSQDNIQRKYVYPVGFPRFQPFVRFADDDSGVGRDDNSADQPIR